MLLLFSGCGDGDKCKPKSKDFLNMCEGEVLELDGERLKLNVTFLDMKLDQTSNGVLLITAVENNTNKTINIIIPPRYEEFNDEKFFINQTFDISATYTTDGTTSRFIMTGYKPAEELKHK
jgi:two-component SAPR family response regulator